MSDRALVRNASDREQVAKAGTKERLQQEQELEDLRKLLSMPEGRRFLWNLLGFCRVYESIFEANSKIAYNSGQQDVGHFIQGLIIKARPEALLQMMQEAQESQ